MTGPSPARLLDIRGLRTHFFTDRGVIRAVDSVDLWVDREEILGVVGESGCGKTVMARSILRIVQKPGRIVGGRVELEGIDLLGLSEAEVRRIRGDAVSMVFQEPMVSLDPVYHVGSQIEEVLSTHRPAMSGRERRQRVLQLLRMVGIPSPEARVNSFPHELSGGMRQRVMIAIALACGNPRLLIADEPTTALDVTVQAQIIRLFQKLQRELGMSLLMITHDLGVISEIADRVVVMYAGSIVEQASVRELFDRPLHPYTRALLRSIPNRDRDPRKSRLYSIAGSVPNLLDLKPGCKFFDRCPHAMADICLGTEPPIEEAEPGHLVRCRRLRGIQAKDSL